MIENNNQTLEDHVEDMRLQAISSMGSLKRKNIGVSDRRHLVVDGYDIIVHFTCADYGICKTESLEICGVYAPFLPFWLVCKVGVKFLGGHEIKLAETFVKSRRVYIWTVAVDGDGKPVSLSREFLREVNYGNINFYVLDNKKYKGK